MSVLIEAAIFLGCAVLAVPLFSRLGLGSILGYLAAGMDGHVAKPIEVTKLYDAIETAIAAARMARAA